MSIFWKIKKKKKKKKKKIASTRYWRNW